jgi:predicted RNA-binding protein with PIN domain
MRYVIDGYNVAHALFGRDAKRASAEEMRDTLLRRLRRFASRKRLVTVVFDSRDGGARTGRRVRSGGCDVRFAPSADEEIISMVRGAKHPGRLRVVTRDREVEGRARQLGADTMRVLDFLGDLEDRCGPDREPGEPPEKYDP